MSEKDSADSAFTPKEIEYMAAAMMCLKDGIPTNAQIDSAKFTKMTNLTEGSAKVIWNSLRRKLIAQATARGTDVPATPKTEGKTKQRATPASKRKGAEDGDEDVATPSKKPRATKAKPKPKPKANLLEDEEAAALDDGDAVKDEGIMDEEVA